MLSAASTKAAALYAKQSSWVDTVLAARNAATTNTAPQGLEGIWLQLKEDFPVPWDWMAQDAGADWAQWLRPAAGAFLEPRKIEAALAELGDSGDALRKELEALIGAHATVTDRRWLELYAAACEARRRRRLGTVLARAPSIVFVKRHTARAAAFAFTEGQSDTQGKARFLPGSELCLLEMQEKYGQVRPLVADATGVIRDPAVSWDGRRIAFAWKKSLQEDDYHLYEFNALSNQARQITAGLGFADYAPAWLPNGDLLFVSSRCVQSANCASAEVGNLYTCDPEGRYLRRLSFDQGDALGPQVTEDGWVLYTRCDHNDRGQAFANGLFQMYPDGTGQTELYGNGGWFPPGIIQARSLPGTGKYLAVLCGYTTAPAGKLALINPNQGREGNTGVQLVAPLRRPPATASIDYGQDGELWRHPYPLGGEEFLVAYAPLGWERSGPRQGDADFGIYWMDLAGRRELLASDPRLPCDQPVVLSARPAPLKWANRVDYSQSGATYYLQDIYAGPGLAGVKRGAIRKLRVVALEFRAAAIGASQNEGRAGSSTVSTPVAIGNGTWEVKKVLGEAQVYADGSALFSVPARTPLYFQALDEQGRAIQTMRSWSTLQPGEYFSCVGCHESKNTAPPTENYGFSLAMKAGRQELESREGATSGFSFGRRVQPILDQHCVSCHCDRAPVLAMICGQAPPPLSRAAGPAHKRGSKTTAFSLLGTALTTDSAAERQWSDAYLVLTQAAPAQPCASGPEDIAMDFRGDCQGRMVNWIDAQSAPEPLPPGFAGSARSGLLALLESGHQGVKLSAEELATIACWIDLGVPYCGDYGEANTWTREQRRVYGRALQKRRAMEEFEQDNIADLCGSKDPSRSPGPARPMISAPPR